MYSYPRFTICPSVARSVRCSICLCPSVCQLAVCLAVWPHVFPLACSFIVLSMSVPPSPYPPLFPPIPLSPSLPPSPSPAIPPSPSPLSVSAPVSVSVSLYVYLVCSVYLVWPVCPFPPVCPVGSFLSCPALPCHAPSCPVLVLLSWSCPILSCPVAASKLSLRPAGH